MKKLLLGLAAICSAGALFAQSQSISLSDNGLYGGSNTSGTFNSTDSFTTADTTPPDFLTGWRFRLLSLRLLQLRASRISRLRRRTVALRPRTRSLIQPLTMIPDTQQRSVVAGVAATWGLRRTAVMWQLDHIMFQISFFRSAVRRPALTHCRPR